MKEVGDTKAAENHPLRQAVGLGVAWLATSAAATAFLYSSSEKEIILADHQATVAPSFDGHYTASLGAITSDIRTKSDLPFNLGVKIDVGNSVVPPGDAGAGVELEATFTRFGAIAAQPSGEIALIEDAVKDMSAESAMWGGAIGTTPLFMYALLGSRRRQELRDKLAAHPRATLVAGLATIALTPGLQAVPLPDDEAMGAPWQPLVEAIPQLAGNDTAEMIEIRDNSDTKLVATLVQGGFQTYEKAKEFYGDLRDRVPEIAPQLHQPLEGQTVAILVTDRHDNISMDPIVADVAEAAQASIIFDAGDDTSSGGTWEEFSLRSLVNEFSDYQLVAVSGNHDNTGFVSKYLSENGAIMPTDTPQQIGNLVVFGAHDPRQSDYTPERREGELSVDEVGDNLAEAACAHDERVNVLLVHDTDAGDESLRRGCVDIVIAGHEHRTIGPNLVTGENGLVGYSYVNASTGGASYSFSLGTKLRRDAQVTALTFDELGNPVGLQGINFTTAGDIIVAPYTSLRPTESETDATVPRSMKNQRRN